MGILNNTFNWTQESKNLTNMDVNNHIFMTFWIIDLIFCLIAVVTNTLIVITISVSIKQWRYSMGTLMLTLAACDTMLNVILCFCLMSQHVHFSGWIMTVFTYLRLDLNYWSRLILLVFSVNRYALVCKPFTHHRITSRKSTLKQIVTLAVIAFTTNIPGIFTRTMTGGMFVIYEIIRMIMSYYIPLIVTFLLTVFVICEFNRNHGTLGVSSESAGARQGERNLTKAMLVTVMAYILLVLPYTVTVSVLLSRSNIDLPESLIRTFFSLFSLNFSINIFIYTLYLPKFRSTLFSLFKCKCCKNVPDEPVRTVASGSVQMRECPS